MSTALRTQIIQRSEQALAQGALRPIATRCEFLPQENISFVVRILPSLARKDDAAKQQRTADPGDQFDPFLPYDETLFVADLSATHLCLLNKFNVLDHHLLIVTRAFEEQLSPLNLQDFQALWRCLLAMEGLAFYNAGAVAGASQRHKHLQLVPLPLAPQGPAIPIETALAGARFEGGIGRVPAFPFAHVLVRLDQEALASPQTAARLTLAHYHTMFHRMGLNLRENRSEPYNLLITRQWMLLIPRAQECFESISINALGFAGALLVKDQQQKQLLQKHGPLAALSQVAA